MKFFYSFFLLLLLQVSCYAGDLREDVIITFTNESISKAENISVEVSRTEPERNRGLMYKRELKEKVGMIFIMPDDVIQSFWMKNTYIPLDMIFIRKDGTVDSILKSVPPLTLTGRKSKGPSKFVLELVGGSAEKLGIVEGSRMTIVEDQQGFFKGYFQ